MLPRNSVGNSAVPEGWLRACCDAARRIHAADHDYGTRKLRIPITDQDVDVLTIAAPQVHGRAVESPVAMA